MGFGSISGSSSPRNSEVAPPLARRAQTLGHNLVNLERASDHQPHHDQAVQDRNRVDPGKVRREAAHDPSHAARDDADREQAACADAFERGARDGKHDLESGLGEAGFGVRHQTRDGHPELDAGKPQVLVEVEADEGKPDPQSARPNSQTRAMTTRRCIEAASGGLVGAFQQRVDESVVEAQRLSNAEDDAGVACSRVVDLARDVFLGVASRAEEVRNDSDLLSARFDASLDSLSEGRFYELEVGELDDDLRSTQPHALGEGAELRIGLGSAATVIDQQNCALHPVLAAAWSAWSRSSHRSSTCSMPTDSRTVRSLMPLRRFSLSGNAA